MSVKRFADAGLLLNWLLDAHEARDRGGANVIAHVDYDRISTHATTQRFEAALRMAENTGGITLEYGRPPLEDHVIKRVRLADPEALYEHLDREPRAVTAARCAGALRSIVAGRPHDIARIPDELEAGWARRKAPYRLEPDDHELAAQFLRLVCGFLDGIHQDSDQRTFARRATGDSKALEYKGQSARVAQVLARHLDLESDNPAEVLEALGIRKFPAPVCVRGPVGLDAAHGEVDLSRLRPYAAMAPDQAPGIVALRNPAYVLTVENFASFNRHVREVRDDGLILYTGGFPSRAVQTVIVRLDNQLDRSVPFLHWGDIDPWGLRIFRHIEGLLARGLRPHLMTSHLAEAGREATPSAAMGKLAGTDSAVAGLATYLANQGARHMEQEQLDPASPDLQREYGVDRETAGCVDEADGGFEFGMTGQ